MQYGPLFMKLLDIKNVRLLCGLEVQVCSSIFQLGQSGQSTAELEEGFQ